MDSVRCAACQQLPEPEVLACVPPGTTPGSDSLNEQEPEGFVGAATHPQKYRKGTTLAGAVALGMATLLVTAACAGPPGTQNGTNGEFSTEQALEAVTAVIDKADETVVPMSELMSQELSDEAVESISHILGKTDEAQSTLDEATQLCSSYSNVLNKKSLLSNLQDAISSRQAMLTNGAVVLQAGVATYELMPTAEDVYTHLTTGQDKLKEAASAIENPTTTQLKKATQLDQEALGLFEQAQDDLAAIASECPDVDLEALVAYAGAQAQTAQAALDVDAALLEESADAETLIGTYTEKADAAAELAEAIPASGDELTKSIYYSFGTDEISVSDAETAYASAAKRAAADDVLIKEF